MSSMLDVRRTLCRQCNVCYPMFPKQEKELCIELEGVKDAPILIINDNDGDQDIDEKMVRSALGLSTQPFTYTESVRCKNPGNSHSVDWQAAAARCSVWTHLLADNRIVILSTRRGLNQLDVPAGVEEGDSFKNLRLGVVLCIPAIQDINMNNVSEYRSKVQRVLKEAGLREKVTA